ncbi:hypothetical protein BSZ19_46870 [Bradyrhizobium japonicum]|uniref:Uncharacterized protein n=1 Tax=Bradyrhizobium japonicum TaxID=375 RepID=A0A1Y2J7L2_BRAJP|nr:hypothetical protein BSZ19_46870 [Bradyrhizobium japonicum]
MSIGERIRQLISAWQRRREIRRLRHVERTFTGWATQEEGDFRIHLLDFAKNAKAAMERLNGSPN